MVTKGKVPHRQILLLTSLLIVMLTSSLLVCTSINGVNGASLENTVHVKNEEELKNAINNAPTNKPTTITLDNDITLTQTTDDHTSNHWPVSIIIPADKDITLTSNKASGYYKLNGAVNGSILFVAPNGTLRIDGIAVIHTSNTGGGGVNVDAFAKFYFYDGVISGNKIYGGSGVSNIGGTFVMSGGEISDNTAENGGGVYNSGTFTMTGGAISGNTATNSGGGVNNAFNGVFTMSGGKISGNTADYGGGVYIYFSVFTMSGGEISGNKATQGGGVYVGISFISGDANNGPAFTMSNGKISSNTANLGGGVYISSSGGFDRRGGIISGNTATNAGNDVYPDNNGNELPGGNDDSVGNNGGGSSNDNNGISISGGFSLRAIVITCVITIVVTLCIVLLVLLVLSQKRLTQLERKQSNP